MAMDHNDWVAREQKYLAWIATLRAENEQLRRERDAIRNETLHKAAMTGYRVCAETRHVTLGGKVEDAIRNLKEPSDV